MEAAVRSEYCCSMPASLELVKIALQAYANGDSRSPSHSPVPRSAGTSAPRAPTASSSGATTRSRGRCARYLDGWQEYRFEIEDIAEVGPGKVVGICRERGKPEDGTPVDRRFGGLWVVEGGKITSWSTYLTPKEAVRAAKELLGGSVRVDQIKRTAPGRR